MGVVLWGHGYSINYEGSFRRAYRNILARWADAVVTYNRRAARQLVEEGMPADRIFVATNALDGDAIDSAVQAWSGTPERLRDFRTRLDIGDRPTALHVSRLNNASNLQRSWIRGD